MATQQDIGNNRLRDGPTGDLVKQAAEQSALLVREEIRLAQLEMQEKGKRAGMGAGMFGGAGLMALYGGGALIAGRSWCWPRRWTMPGSRRSSSRPRCS